MKIVVYEKQRILNYSKPYTLRQMCDFLYLESQISLDMRNRLQDEVYKRYKNEKRVSKIQRMLRLCTQLDILVINRDRYIIRYN